MDYFEEGTKLLLFFLSFLSFPSFLFFFYISTHLFFFFIIGRNKIFEIFRSEVKDNKIEIARLLYQSSSFLSLFTVGRNRSASDPRTFGWAGDGELASGVSCATSGSSSSCSGGTRTGAVACTGSSNGRASTSSTCRGCDNSGTRTSRPASR